MSETSVQSASIVPADTSSLPPFEGDLQAGLPLQISVNLCDQNGNFKSMETLKLEIIKAVIKSCENVSKAAHVLELGRSTIYRLKGNIR